MQQQPKPTASVTGIRNAPGSGQTRLSLQAGMIGVDKQGNECAACKPGRPAAASTAVWQVPTSGLGVELRDRGGRKQGGGSVL